MSGTSDASKAQLGLIGLSTVMVALNGCNFYLWSPFESLVEAGVVLRGEKTIEVDPEARDLLSNLIGQISEFDKHADESPSPKGVQERSGEGKE